MSDDVLVLVFLLAGVLMLVGAVISLVEALVRFRLTRVLREIFKTGEQAGINWREFLMEEAHRQSLADARRKREREEAMR
jgi:hypothetical protein